MMLQPTLLKVGGAELVPGESLDKLVDVVARLSREKRLIVVHGGGPEIARWQEKVGLEPKTVDGLRVTDEASLEVAEMVLSGLVNKRLVGKLVALGVQAVGLSGVDAGLLWATRIQAHSGSLGLVGEINAVNTVLLNQLLDAGYVPVISPISTGKSDLTLNVNADHAALAIARAVKAAEALFLTNVPGVLDGGRLRPTLSSCTA
ncbi:MAG: acetylglutamate kinase, partial [Anaerolineae bacterium]